MAYRLYNIKVTSEAHMIIKSITIGDYLIKQDSSGEITIMGGIDTYIGWSGSFESAVELVKSWVK